MCKRKQREREVDSSFAKVNQSVSVAQPQQLIRCFSASANYESMKQRRTRKERDIERLLRDSSSSMMNSQIAISEHPSQFEEDGKKAICSMKSRVRSGDGKQKG